MANLINLMDLAPNKVSTNLYDYTMMITAPTGFGKTPLIAELFGEDALIFAFENSAKGIEGSYVVNIDSYTTLTYYMQQLKLPQIREKFKVIVIDTLWMFDYICENAVLEQYGKDIISDCLQWNKGYKVKDKKAIDMLNDIKGMGYGICYVCHPTDKKIQIDQDKFIVKQVPKVSDRILDVIVPEVDIRFFGTYDSNGERVLCTQGTQNFDARCRVGQMNPIIKADANVIKEEFKQGILRKHKNKDLLVDKLETIHTVKAESREFEVVMEELYKLGSTLASNGKGDIANEILNKSLGSDSEGRQRTMKEITPQMVDMVETIILKLKAEL